MSQKKSVAISCLACAVVMIVVAGILLSVQGSDEVTGEAAAFYDQLELAVDLPIGKKTVKIWQSKEGIYYFFLPSGSESYDISFSNLAEESSLWLDSDLFNFRNSTIDNITYSKTYDMVLKLSEEGQALPTAQVIFLKSEGVPALFIDTASGSMDAVHSDKEVKEEASVLLLESDGSKVYSGDIEYIKARGNSSFNRDKKSYLIKLRKDYGFFGMPKAEKWVLQANVFDDSLLKNELVFRFTEQYTTVPSIRGHYTDLYLNGNYVGNYYLCDKIEVGENRVNITDLEEETEKVNIQSSYRNAALYVSDDGMVKATEGLNNPKDITGGYLLEYIGTGKYEEAANAFMTDHGYCYEIVSPSPATVEQAEYIRNYFNEMETAVWREDGINPETGKHYSEYIDVDSWAAKYMIEELFHDMDAGGASMFFYKDADSIDPHIFSGPMWDYDRTLGSYGYGSQQLFLDGANDVGDCGLYIPCMMQHQEVRELVYEKFRQYGMPYAENLAKADIYHLGQSIYSSAAMNRIRWPKIYGHYSELEANWDYLGYYLEQRADHLREVWLEGEDYCTVKFLNYSGGLFAEYTVKKGECLDAVPSIASYIAVFNGWYSVNGGIAFDIRLPVLEDVTYQSDWLEIDSLLLNGVDAAEMDISQADPETLRKLADRLEQMQRENAAGDTTDEQGGQ